MAMFSVLLEAAKDWASEGGFFAALRADFFGICISAGVRSPGVPDSGVPRERELARLGVVVASSARFRLFARRASSWLRSAWEIFWRAAAMGLGVGVEGGLEMGVRGVFISLYEPEWRLDLWEERREGMHTFEGVGWG